MKFKYLLGFVLSFMCFISFNVVAHAEEFEVLKGKPGFLKNNPKAKFVNMTDGDLKTSDMFYLPETAPVYFDLGDTMTVNGFQINASAKGGMDRLSVNFLDENFNTLKTYRAMTENQEAIKNVRYISFSYIYINEIVIYDFKVFANDGKLSNVKNLQAKSTKTQVSLTWKNPIEEALSGLKIYQDNKLIATLTKDKTSYIAEGLKPFTKYKFKVTSVDEEGI
ncbi:fibronectin type III domain-containing protein, partial [Bacillus cereus group sp. Bc008]